MYKFDVALKVGNFVLFYGWNYLKYTKGNLSLIAQVQHEYAYTDKICHSFFQCILYCICSSNMLYFQIKFMDN